MNFYDALSVVLKVRRVIAVVTILAGGAGYKFGPGLVHKYHSGSISSHTVSAKGASAATDKLAANDLGEVTLTNHYETSVSLGHGKNCRVVPRKIDNSNMELTLSLESLTAEGAVHDLSVTQITAKTGKPTEIAIGDVQFSLTPKLLSE